MSDADDSFDSLLASIDIPVPTETEPLSVAAANITKNRSADIIPSTCSKSATSSSDVMREPLRQTPSTPYHILVHSRQRGNPLLKAIRSVPYEFADIVPDYVVGATACVLFLSLQYHALNPDYIHDRLKQLGKRFELRVLLVQIDTKEPHNALKHLTRLCFLADLTLMLAWNAEEAGAIVETYKKFENRPPDWIQERVDHAPHQKLVGALTNIKPVNKTDAMTLLQNFGPLANLIKASESQLVQCPGLGPRKATKLFRTFNEPFLSS